MALRAFRNNPSLGGFGDENSGGIVSSGDSRSGDVPSSKADAFAQIVKELVDNAADACEACLFSSNLGSSKKPDASNYKRIRVLFEEVSTMTAGSCSKSQSPKDLLKVTVSDNGIGMDHSTIMSCVSAFSSSKSNKRRKILHTNKELITGQVQTTGRYGIGLTLCLLHAQSLVKNSYAVITSTTKSCTSWSKLKYIVDDEKDEIVCVEEDSIEKSNSASSGTFVCMLVPGGEIARQSWPRLTEYFSRFQLNKELHFSLEAKAPMLSKLPLYIRPILCNRNHKNSRYLEARSSLSDTDDDDNTVPNIWHERVAHESFSNNNDDEPMVIDGVENGSDLESRSQREIIMEMAQYYLKCPIKFQNTAHSVFPIHHTSFVSKKDRPRIEVDLVVYNQGLNDAYSLNQRYESDKSMPLNSSSSPWNGEIMLVRIVNGVPMLDGVEAYSCGLVQGLASMRNTWKAFGLDITMVSGNDQEVNMENQLSAKIVSHANAPVYNIKDSIELAQYLKEGTHDKFYVKGKEGGGLGSTEKKLPAGIRIGKILIIVHLRANPIDLPLPTLSKGRLPMNDPYIKRAFELGIISCLKSLQSSNPDLLISKRQMIIIERNSRYIPTLSNALACIIRRSENVEMRTSMAETISTWVSKKREGDFDSKPSEEIYNNLFFDIESRLHYNYANKPMKKYKSRKKRIVHGNDDDSYTSKVFDENSLFDSSSKIEEQCKKRFKSHLFGESSSEKHLIGPSESNGLGEDEETFASTSTSRSTVKHSKKFDESDVDDGSDDDWW